MEGLSDLDDRRWIGMSYEGFLKSPETICNVIDGKFALKHQNFQDIPTSLALSRTTISNPDPEKWKRHSKFIMPLLPQLEKTFEDIKTFCRGRETPI